MGIYGADKGRAIMKNILKLALPGGVWKFASNKLKRDKRIRLVFGTHEIVIGNKGEAVSGVVPLLYWDGKPNFGDMIGPYLISKITGKPVLNIKDSSSSGFMSVGSVLQLANRKGLVVWGSGLIDAPSEKLVAQLKKYNPEVLSVRGMETAAHLEKAGIKVKNSKAVGDPALIMPQFYSPKSTKTIGKLAVCPHYIHKSKFLGLSDNVCIVDVQEDIESVIDEINSSEVCISTSLHGLIIAQAYGVPWVWLEIVDKNLGGGDFKFKDFFSTLGAGQTSHVQVLMDDVPKIDWQEIAGKASLPDKRYDEKLILKVIEERLAIS